MSKEMFDLFALVDDKDNPIKRIPLSDGLQRELTEYLLKQITEFRTDQRMVDFSGGYNADEGEILRIRNYPLNQNIVDAIKNPLGYDILDLREMDKRITALFTGIATPKACRIGFQSFDPRKILSKGFTIINSGNTYTKLEDPGLTLQDKLTALYDDGQLFFYSYHSTRHFIDLSAYYREATDTDLEDFASDKSLYIEDLSIFMKNADLNVRKKITLLQKNKVLGKVAIKNIRSTAKRFGIDIEIKGGKKIVLPNEKKELLNILRFLDEDYFDTVLTKRRCMTNSKEYI